VTVEPTADATPDTVTVTPGNPTPSVLNNDTVNGSPLSPSQVVLTPVTVPTGFTLNPNGTISVASGTTPGTYSLVYRICQVSNPTVCDTATATVTVLTISVVPTVTIASPIVIEGNAAIFVITLSSPSTVPTIISIVTSTGTAGSSDFTAVATTVVIPANTTTVAVSVPTINDLVVEPTETFTLIATVLSTNTVTSSISATGTVLDDDIEQACEIVVYNAVAPDSSIGNNTFQIDGLNCYPENNVMIYNRWGILVFEREGYNSSNAFKGFSEGRVNVQQGEGLPVGTYWYILSYKAQGGNLQEKAGYLYINR
jgi:gliding motility-associated-like protein